MPKTRKKSASKPAPAPKRTVEAKKVAKGGKPEAGASVLVSDLPPKPRKSLSSACAEIVSLARQITELTDIKNALREEVKETVRGLGLSKVEGPGWMVLRFEKSSSKIRADWLLEAGVEMAVIEGATETRTWEETHVKEPRRKKEDA